MKIAIGADHRGFKMKRELIRYLKSKHHQVLDIGTHDENSCDYPEYGWKVAQAVACGKAQRGILICNSGIGQSIVANKVRGVRAALAANVRIARLAREHNDSNVLVLASILFKLPQARKAVNIWIKTRAKKGRHARRVRAIGRLERSQFRRGRL